MLKRLSGQNVILSKASRPRNYNLFINYDCYSRCLNLGRKFFKHSKKLRYHVSRENFIRNQWILYTLLNGIADAILCQSFDKFHPLQASHVNVRAAFFGREKHPSLAQTSRPPMDWNWLSNAIGM